MRQLQELERDLAAAREACAELRAKRMTVEQSLWKAGEAYRMGVIGLAEYDRQVNILLGDQKREEKLAGIDAELTQRERQQQWLERQHKEFAATMPNQRTMTAMQITFALLIVFILIGGILVLDHPQGMVIYNPEQQIPTTEAREHPWSTTIAENPPAP